MHFSVRLMPLLVLLVTAPVPAEGVKDRTITVGALFDSTDKGLPDVLKHAVERTNAERWLRPKTRLAWTSNHVARDDSFSASKKVCSLLKTGVGAIIGPQTAKSSSHVQSICHSLQIPHVEMREDFRPHKSDSSVNVAPHPHSLGRAFADLIESWSWYTHFSILYEDVLGLARVQEILKLPNKRAHLYQLGPGEDYRPLLKKIKLSGDTRIIIDCKVETVLTVLRQAQQVGMTSEYYDYIFTNLDLHTVSFQDYYRMRVNITGFQLIDSSLTQFRDILLRWRGAGPVPSQGRNLTNPEHNVKTEMALVYDAVLVFARALSDLDKGKELDLRTPTCDYDMLAFQSNPLIAQMRQTNVTGLTGPIQFNPDGLRTNFSLVVIKLLYTAGKPGFKRIATWNEEVGITTTLSESELQQENEATLATVKLVVTTIMNPPFFMNKTNVNQLTGNDKYEGFIVDLMEALAEEENFEYEIRPVADGKYGAKNDKTGLWDGMVGELMNKQADIVAADLTITKARQEAVDFTIPFMNLGISILYKKPEKKPTSLFSFLKPLSAEVWVYMATAYLGVSIILFVLARFSPYEWDNPHPCKANPEVLQNMFNLTNSMWFTISSVMQQGCDIAPKAISTRMVAGTWWFFTLIMISSYTANLAAFLTSERMVSPVSSAEDLVRQTKIKYGCVEGGSTQNYFKKSTTDTYKKIYTMMDSAEPSLYARNNDEGVERVRKTDYAFFMESTVIEYRVNRDCSLMQIGGLLDNKGYGIATPKDSPHRVRVNRGVMALLDKGVLGMLKRRWWQEKGAGATQCAVDDEAASSSMKLGVAKVGGVFVLLMGGMGFACIIGIFEFVWNTRRAVREQRDSVCSEMAKELKFALNCTETTKPVAKSPSSEPENGLAIPLTGYGGFGDSKDPLS